jgi:hypothetical protein
LHNDEFLTRLAYLGEVFTHLNDSRITGSLHNFNVRDRIEAMIKKFELFSVCINKEGYQRAPSWPLLMWRACTLTSHTQEACRCCNTSFSRETLPLLHPMIASYNLLNWYYPITTLSLSQTFSFKFPKYANLRVGQFEEALLYKTETHPLLSKILLRKRYIDDVFVLWEGSQQELNEYQTLLNKCSEYLKFTMQTDERKLNYLELWIIKESITHRLIHKAHRPQYLAM